LAVSTVMQDVAFMSYSHFILLLHLVFFCWYHCHCLFHWQFLLAFSLVLDAFLLLFLWLYWEERDWQMVLVLILAFGKILLATCQ